jgi:hypothetical protein
MRPSYLPNPQGIRTVSDVAHEALPPVSRRRGRLWPARVRLHVTPYGMG